MRQMPCRNFKKCDKMQSHFHEIFGKVNKICTEYDIDIKKPRINKCQINRCNVDTESVEDYYRIAFYIPFIDTYITHIQSRFMKHKSIFENFGVLFPKNEYNFEKSKKLYEFYQNVPNCSKNQFASEVKMWRKRVDGQNFKNVFDALEVSVILTFNYNMFVRYFLCI